MDIMFRVAICWWPKVVASCCPVLPRKKQTMSGEEIWKQEDRRYSKVDLLIHDLVPLAKDSFQLDRPSHSLKSWDFSHFLGLGHQVADKKSRLDVDLRRCSLQSMLKSQAVLARNKSDDTHPKAA